MDERDRGGVVLLPPEEYDGEELCPCCGIGRTTGRRFAICIDGYTCAETCAHHVYSEDLCPACDDPERTLTDD